MPVATGITLGVGAAIFALLVWLSFWVGFERLRPDLGLDSIVSLAASPEVEFDAEAAGWELVAGADPTTGFGPQYAQAVRADEPVCVISWQSGSLGANSVNLTGLATDLEGTQAVLDAAGMQSEGTERVRVMTEAGETLEMLYVPQVRADGLDSASAARAFVGSEHYLVFTLVCEAGGDLSPERMYTVLEDALVVARPLD